MLRSMFSGVSGLRSHQTMVDNIGNNIANVNTFGFKSSTVVFQDLLSQVLQGAGMPADAVGGTNPSQIGLGVKVAGINTSFTQGAAQSTGRSTDLSIQGDGFFMVANAAGEQLFTRAGALNFDALGRLVTVSGDIVQGWTAAADGTINRNAGVGNIVMPMGQQIAPQATDAINLGGNLDHSAVDGTQVLTSITIFDEQGAPIEARITFERTAGAWTVAVELIDAAGTATSALAATPVAFDADGSFAGPSPTFTVGGTTVTLDGSGLVSYAGGSGAAALSQTGSPMGTLQSFTIGGDGTINGVFSNGRTRPLGQIALANFNNPGGLEKAGNSTYRATVNSGNAQIGAPGTGGRGSILSSTLEMSNVDLAAEFTNLIIAQRGYQANSRVITSSDELLQELVNLKR
jgi:flagellar hook protein FlgE